jgi:hypothetical protein
MMVKGPTPSSRCNRSALGGHRLTSPRLCGSAVVYRFGVSSARDGASHMEAPAATQAAAGLITYVKTAEAR